MFENRKRLRKGYSFTIPLKDLNANRKQIYTWRFFFLQLGSLGSPFFWDVAKRQ